jgi:pyrimidine dimer DNA glycosylase
MRLWSLHPSLLDARGLVAVWREGLLAQKVLRGATKGYRHHPQLQRFRRTREPTRAIANYLWAIHDEAERRGYSFDGSKINGQRRACRMVVSRGQLAFEWAHLKKKVCVRDPEWFEAIAGGRRIRAHPLFMVVPGKVEPWERGPGSQPVTE